MTRLMLVLVMATAGLLFPAVAARGDAPPGGPDAAEPVTFEAVYRAQLDVYQLAQRLAAQVYAAAGAGEASGALHPWAVRIREAANLARGLADDGRRAAQILAEATRPKPQTPNPNPGLPEPSADTVTIYVASPPAGDDDNPGTIAAPVATLARGYELLRDGFPDRLLVRRGDEFTMTGDDPGWHNWCKSGRSADERMVIGNYGDPGNPQAPIPVIHTGGHGFVRMWGGASHLLFSGFDARSDRSPGGADPPQEAGIRFRSATAHDVTFAGITLTGFFTGVEINGSYNDADVSGVTLRRCTIRGSWAPVAGPGSGHAQGLFATGFEGLAIEGCIFDHNGWLPGHEDQRTVFRHQVYLAEMRGVTIRGCVFADEAFGAIKVRSDHGGASGGILIEGNVFARSLFSIGVGGDPASGDPTAVLHRGITIRGNVFTDAGATLPNGQAWARAIGIRQAGGVLIEGNYLIDPAPAPGPGPGPGYADHTPIVLAPDGLPHGDITVRGNVIGWGTPGSEIRVGPDKTGIVVGGGNTFGRIGADVDIAGLLSGEVSAGQVIRGIGGVGE